MLGGGARLTTTGSDPAIGLVQQSYPSGATTWTGVGTLIFDLDAGETMTIQAYVICTS